MNGVSWFSQSAPPYLSAQFVIGEPKRTDKNCLFCVVLSKIETNVHLGV